MTDNPAELLRHAATLIRSLGEHVSPGPWMTSNSRTHWLADDVVFGQSVWMANRISQVCNVDYGQNQKPDAAWIALMDPATGTALAEWLDYAARRHEALVTAAHQVWADDTAGRDKHIADETDQRALAVARAVLGEVAE